MGNVIAKYRATAGRLLLVLLTGYAVLNLLWQQIHLYPGMSGPGHDPRGANLQLRPLLPPSGPVGYVTTVENGGIFAAEKTFTNADVPLAFFLLATLVLLFLPARSPETAASAGDRPGPRSAQPKTRPTKGNKPKRIQEPK